MQSLLTDAIKKNVLLTGRRLHVCFVCPSLHRKGIHTCLFGNGVKIWLLDEGFVKISFHRYNNKKRYDIWVLF